MYSVLGLTDLIASILILIYFSASMNFICISEVERYSWNELKLSTIAKLAA